MKIAIFSIPEINPGKYNVKDPRLDQVDSLVKAKKKTYVQVELAQDATLLEADSILALKDCLADLILKDLEFVETRLSRSADEKEKVLLNKLKNALEHEQLLSTMGLAPDELSAMSSYNILTVKPIIAVEKEACSDLNALLLRALTESGFISFFTAGEKETRAWLIKKGTTAWEAAGVIHSDIQRGFIRAEIISLADFLNSGGENQAKQAGKLRLEQKDYIMQDADLTNFRFNK